MRLIRKLLRSYRRVTPYQALLLSPLARPAPRMLWRSKDTLRKACVYVHFDRPRPGARLCAASTAREIRGCGFDILFVSNRLTLDDETDKQLRELCAGEVMVRRNRGHDFGAWKDGIAVLGDPRGLDALLLANDSVYGPIYPLADVLQRLRFDAADVWGITDNWDIRYHLQSYFLLFSPAALRQRRVPPVLGPAALRTVQDLGGAQIRSRLTTAMLRAGLRWRRRWHRFAASPPPYSTKCRPGCSNATTSSRSAKSFWREPPSIFLKESRSTRPINSGTIWSPNFGCPFIKARSASAQSDRRSVRAVLGKADPRSQQLRHAADRRSSQGDLARPQRVIAVPILRIHAEANQPRHDGHHGSPRVTEGGVVTSHGEMSLSTRTSSQSSLSWCPVSVRRVVVVF